MSAGITRIHGTAIPQTLTGGYQFKFFTITDSTVNYSTGYTLVNSNFEKAVRAIETNATIVLLGTPTSSGFTVAVDGASFQGRGDNTGYAADNSTATIATVINSFVGTTGTVATAVSLSGVTLA